MSGGFIKQTISESELKPYPYIAVVTGHADKQKMGSLKVSVFKGKVGDITNSFESMVSYCPPFFGQTPYEAMDGNARSMNSSQTSYGMWMVPPDLGAHVMVVFANGNPNDGYWIGCVPQTGMNQMVPGIAASRYVELTPQQKQKLYGNDNTPVPVTEYNRRLPNQTATNDLDTINKPMHPFALRLAEQGLLKDPIRGTTTSSARRAPISNVYGISTPGPIKAVGGKVYNMGEDENTKRTIAEREGGTQFVMDDGFVGFDERTGKKGLLDEHVRIRTRTGHQILLHNSSDLIYICNSKGTAWMEFTSDGKIDIFADDSVSIHTETDFNFRAERDINMEAGRNINMATLNNINMEAGGQIEGLANSEVNFTSVKHVNLYAGGKLRLTSAIHPTSPKVSNGIEITSKVGNINLFSETGDIKAVTPMNVIVSSGLGTSLISTTTTSIQSGGEMYINTVGNNIIKSVAANILTSATHMERASVLIDMNGPTTAPVATASAENLTSSITKATSLISGPPGASGTGAAGLAAAELATSVSNFIKHELPYRGRDRNADRKIEPGKIPQQKGWENNNYYAQRKISSITKRVPTHEPWDHHESIMPDEFKPEKTDREL